MNVESVFHEHGPVSRTFLEETFDEIQIIFRSRVVLNIFKINLATRIIRDDFSRNLK